MERIGKIQLLKMTSGYNYKVQGLLCCIVLNSIFVLGDIDNLLWLELPMLIISLFIIASLLLQYNKVVRIMKNGKIIKTKVITVERTYYGIKYELKLRLGSVFVMSTYYDEKTGRNYLFKTYCDKKNIFDKRQYWENDLLKIDCDYLNVYVNKDNYSDYIFAF